MSAYEPTLPDDCKQNECFVKCYTSPDEFRTTGTLRLPLESFIIYTMFRGLQVKIVKLLLVHLVEENPDHVELRVKDEPLYKSHEMTPWPVQCTVYPCVLYEDTVITGLCAVARHIVGHRIGPFCTREHMTGLLGFRNSCLQAPNEVSVWTKFCEIDIFRTTHKLLKSPVLKRIPQNLVRFETHLSKPVRIHNIKKVQQVRSKLDVMMGAMGKVAITLNGPVTERAKVQKDLNSKAVLTSKSGAKTKIKTQTETDTEATKAVKNSDIDVVPPLKDKRTIERKPKTRKWKSTSKMNMKSDIVEDLHEFAEGQFFSVADLMLLPQYHIIRERIGIEIFKLALPLTDRWYTNIMDLPEALILKDIFSSVSLTPVALLSMELPECPDCSLYKRDPKRSNPRKRIFTKEADIENALRVLTSGMELAIENNSLHFDSVNMAELPKFVNPMGGWLPESRAERKTVQLHNLVLAVKTLAKNGDVIVDFCCGSGHLGLILAYLLPKCTIILLENKSKSLADANQRAILMPLNNIIYFQCNLDFFVGKFDIGIGLHACGIATDLILDKCLKAKAKFVLTPCCYGSLHETDRFVYPRSKMFHPVSLDKYMCICHASDQTHDDQHPLTERGERCMAIIDSDRGHLAREHGYRVTLTKLKPLSCTPKNNLLIGEPFYEPVS